MEKKLAEFRARRQAEHAAMKDNRNGGECREQTVVADQKAAGCQHTEETAQAATISAPPSSQLKGSSDWLLDSAVGRWLNSRKLVLSNLTLLKVLLWLVLLGLFVELEFGLPFFVLSLFYWIYEGMRGPSERQPGELSAYSVFNPDCQPILGTVTAEQLEREMGFNLLAH